VFISDGAGGAISIILDSFINPGDVLLVEEFTYMGSLRMMLERGAEPIHVLCDHDGMLPDALKTPRLPWRTPVAVPCSCG